MSFALIVFLIIVAISIFKGYRSGIEKMVYRFISLAIAYVVAIFLTKPFAQWLKAQGFVEGLIVYAVAGVGLFSLALLFFFLMGKVFNGFLLRKSSGTLSSVAGGFIGGVFGCVVGFFAIWFLGALHGLFEAKSGKALIEPSAFQNKVQQITGNVISYAADKVGESSSLNLDAAKLLINPGKNIQHFQRLSRSSEWRDLFRDPHVIMAVDSRKPGALLDTRAFKGLTSHPDFVALTQELDLPEKPVEREQHIALQMTKVWTQVKQVQDDPEFQAIINEPTVRNNIQEGNLYQLLKSTKVEKLLQIISSSQVDDIDHQNFFIESESELPRKTESTIYRWVDENGKVHFSDQEKK